MPPSDGSKFILDLLAKSVAKVNSQGEKRGRQEETGKLLASAGVKRRKVDSENKEHSNQHLDLNSKGDSEVLKVKTISEHNDNIVKSLVYNHLKKVSPKLAEEFSTQFTMVEGSLKLERVVDFSYRKLVTLSKEKRARPTKKFNLRITAKKFTSQEDTVIKAATHKDEAVNFVALGRILNRKSDTVKRRAEFLERTGGLKTRLPFTLIEDQIIIETVVIPELENRKLNEVFPDSLYFGVAKQLGKNQTSVRERWGQTLQPWMLQHYSGTLNLRVERMLANHIADTYTEFNQIDWRKVTDREEFVGHTEKSLRGLYFNQLRDATRRKLNLAREEVDLQHIVEYCELVYGKESQGRSKPRLIKKTIQRQRDVISFFEEKVAKQGIKNFL